ncbi:hypothetical protein ACTWQB_13205 [Piscibacillus sp. B03]|uniref:hypothetical protein n=1 Tax=Piscibacillus sp. B03 TaxID=3457430 RepID=UPI003FCDD5C9
MILWETFDKNELYVIAFLVIVYALVFYLPKILPSAIVVLFLVWGFAVSTLFDFTIGGGLINFYRVNDSNQYELTDLLTYFSFATISYFFVYFYEKFKINKKTFIPYMLVWTVIGVIMEWLTTVMGVINYQDDYSWGYSIIVFLVVLTGTAMFYELVRLRLKTKFNSSLD